MRELDDLVERLVDQTRRRVFDGDTVPATGKVASLFEPHTDIIREGGRRTHYGHKLNLTTGRSGLVLDAVVDDGNPADSERCLPMLVVSVAHDLSALVARKLSALEGSAGRPCSATIKMRTRIASPGMHPWA